MMPKRISILVMAALHLLSGCGGGGGFPMADMASAKAPSPTMKPNEEAEAPGSNFEGLALGTRGPESGDALASNAPFAPAASASPTSAAPASSSSEAFQQQSPILIYTATMNMAVFQVSEASKQVEAMAREVGGFLARRDDSTLVIRVPAAKFDDLLKRIEKLGDVLNRNVVAEDVTEQYMDAEVRLKNARAVRDRLQQLLEKATKVEDSLAIEKELTRVGNDIEVLEGKLKYLRDRARYSTITVSFRPKQSDTIKPSVKLPVPWLNELGLGRLLNL